MAYNISLPMNEQESCLSWAWCQESWRLGKRNVTKILMKKIGWSPNAEAALTSLGLSSHMVSSQACLRKLASIWGLSGNRSRILIGMEPGASRTGRMSFQSETGILHLWHHDFPVVLFKLQQLPVLAWLVLRCPLSWILPNFLNSHLLKLNRRLS